MNGFLTANLLPSSGVSVCSYTFGTKLIFAAELPARYSGSEFGIFA